MNQKRRHVLNVYSQEISLFSSDSEEYMLDLANFVDERMHAFADGVSRISFGDLSILTSLSIADDYFKHKEEMYKSNDEKEKLENDLSLALSRIMSLEADARERESKIEELEEKIQNLGSSLDTKIDSKESLIKKLNVLSYELQKPLEERQYEETLKDAYELLENSKDSEQLKDVQ